MWPQIVVNGKTRRIVPLVAPQRTRTPVIYLQTEAKFPHCWLGAGGEAVVPRVKTMGTMIAGIAARIAMVIPVPLPRW
jgi:hypothetical protein